METYFSTLPKLINAVKLPMPGPADATGRSQEGSVIFIALMVLVIMTVVGLMMSQTVVTENFIVRNQGIYKQNIYMTEAALMEGFQLFRQIPPESDDLNVNTSSLAWINSMHNATFNTDGTSLWYTPDSSTRILDAGNSMPITTSQTLADRGEAGAGNLRTGFVGWAPSDFPDGGSESITTSAKKVVIRQGRLLAEYVSNAGGGMMRMEIGVRRKFVEN